MSIRECICCRPSPCSSSESWANAQFFADTTLLDLLDTLDIRGAIVTCDAAFTHPVVARKIRDKGADYVLTVKDNKPGLRRKLEQAFGAEAAFSPGDDS
jgi:predicted transposase YbfD/YdcC